MDTLKVSLTAIVLYFVLFSEVHLYYYQDFYIKKKQFRMNYLMIG